MAKTAHFRKTLKEDLFKRILEPGCSCREAVACILAEQVASGQQITASPTPGAYCWFGRRVWIVDGSTCSMPDMSQDPISCMT